MMIIKKGSTSIDLQKYPEHQRESIARSVEIANNSERNLRYENEDRKSYYSEIAEKKLFSGIDRADRQELEHQLQTGHF